MFELVAAVVVVIVIAADAIAVETDLYAAFVGSVSFAISLCLLAFLLPVVQLF